MSQQKRKSKEYQAKGSRRGRRGSLEVICGLGKSGVAEDAFLETPTRPWTNKLKLSHGIPESSVALTEQDVVAGESPLVAAVLCDIDKVLPF